MQPLNNARQLAWRALLSALAGGGLTTAALGACPDSALAAGVPSVTVNESSPGGGETATTPAPATTHTTTQPASTQAASSEQPSTQATSTQSSTTTTEPSEERSTTTSFAPPPPPARSKSSGGSKAVTLKAKPKSSKKAAKSKNATATTPHGANNVALPPALVAGQARAIAAALASSTVSVQALGFYRIPLFLLPIYKAAAVQYGVPWQILAAINEIETDYGNDQSVSSAGAVGWMQFMPETWLQYGVDALNAGYADPYNPVDAVFAAARYLRAAGAASNLPAAIFSYNHSQEYVASVLLRAKLISSYPKTVIATLTGLTDGRLPVTGTHLSWKELLSLPAGHASATAGATALAAPGTPSATGAATGAANHAATAPSPAVSAGAGAGSRARPAPQTQQLAEVTGSPGAAVVAAQDGRIAQLGHSARLGNFVVLRDVYGDLFTYAGLGSVAKSYLPARGSAAASSPTLKAASTNDPAPSKPATAGRQPQTLKLAPPKSAAGAAASAAHAFSSSSAGYEATSTPGKVRLFAHPGNPDARAAAASAARARRAGRAPRRAALRTGAVVTTGTVLGHVRVPSGAHAGHMRFAIRPAGDSATIDPRPILTNWAELGLALHPQGAKAANPLLGATAGDVLLLSRAELERAVLSDPHISLDTCSRHEVAAGRIDRRVLAVLAYLSQSGLRPTATLPACSPAVHLSAAAAKRASAQLDITAVNRIAVAGHQGAGTITDLTIRTLLTLPEQFAPHTIASLMRYPGTRSTHAAPRYWNRVRVTFEPAASSVATSHAAPANAARSAKAALSSVPLQPTFVSASQWEQLMSRVSALPVPTVQAQRSPAAVPDPKHR
jgi:soluble lytic murein transglycosylase-like protein